MSDYTLAPANTLIVGMIGSGKSTFGYRYLLNASAACRFVFDDLGRAATRLGLRPCYTAAELESALSTRWVLFNPSRMFPGDYLSAFRFYCQWCFDVSKRGPGKKFLLVDEVWQWQTNHQIPKELAVVVQVGREENLELVCCTQLPHKVHSSIVGQSTEVVCFRLQEHLALDCVQELGADSAAVQALPMGTFISLNRTSNVRLSGRVF